MPPMDSDLKKAIEKGVNLSKISDEELQSIQIEKEKRKSELDQLKKSLDDNLP